MNYTLELEVLKMAQRIGYESGILDMDGILSIYRIIMKEITGR